MSHDLPTSCNACGGPLREWLPAVVDPQTRESFGIAVCAACGLGHTLPQPGDLAPYYAGYHGGRHGFTARYCAARHVRFLRRAAGEPDGRRLLDVGCGDGTFLLAARDGGWHVAGTELDPTIARQAGLDVWGTLDEAGARAPYGCITLWHSLEHVRDPRAMIENVSRLLEPDGTLLVAVPNAGGLQARTFGAAWVHLDVPRHLFHFTRRSLVAIVETAGLEIVRFFRQELEIDVFGWSQSALNLLFEEPNIFYHQLVGRPTNAGPFTRAASFAAGALLSALGLPLSAAGAVAWRSAVLVLAARARR